MNSSRRICLLTLVLVSLSSAAYADCPNCYKDQEPLGPLRGYSADGRTKILVGVLVGATGDSWASPPGTNTADPRLAAAAGQGMSMWNNATDSNGNKTHFYFDTIGGTHPVSSVDVVIVKRPVMDSTGNRNPEAEMETGGGRPYKLLIREDVVARMSDSDLAGLIAHELGHRIGLANSECPGTIMQNQQNIYEAADGSIKMRQTTIAAQDVRMTRVNYDSSLRPTCSASDPKDNYLDSEGDAGDTCADADADGITTCAGDCNDNYYDPYNNCGALYCPDQQYPCRDDEWWSETQCGCVCNPMYCTPVIIDTVGDGFRLTDVAGGVSFDLTGDGSTERISWTAAGSDDALLVLDRNGNGVIDGGAEAFGGVTPQPPSDSPNGFRALALFDELSKGGNGDGAVDGADEVFSSLRLWRDADHDGVSDPGELHTLPSLGVFKIELAHKESRRRDRYGNEFRYRAKVYGADGANLGRWAWDVIFLKGR